MRALDDLHLIPEPPQLEPHSTAPVTQGTHSVPVLVGENPGLHFLHLVFENSNTLQFAIILHSFFAAS